MRVTAIRQGQFITEERERPAPGSGQVLVRNLACGICGSDLHMFKAFSDMAKNQPDVQIELVPGHEFCSEIVEFGEDTKQDLELGQRVCSIPFLQTATGQDSIGVSPTAPGAYSEFMLLSEALLIPVPDNTSTEAAALAEPLAVAIHAVAKAKLKGDESALVMGCGPIGLAVIAALRLSGVKGIIASDYSAKRRELAVAMGADSVIDPVHTSAFTELKDSVGEHTHNAIIFECIGAKNLLAQICAEAPRHARIVIAGLCTEEDTFSPFIAMKKELTIQFVFYYEAEEFAQALQVLAEDKINWRPFITGKVGLEGIAAAFKALQDPDNHAKILIDPWQQDKDITEITL